MKKINPLYILALLTTLLLISINQLQNIKQELNDENRNLEELIVKANIFSEYKNQWLDKKAIENKLNKIKNNPIFKNEKIKIDWQKNSAKIIFDSLNRSKQSSFLNMFLNETFIIKSMNFTKEKLVIEVSTE